MSLQTFCLVIKHGNFGIFEAKEGNSRTREVTSRKDEISSVSSHNARDIEEDETKGKGDSMFSKDGE
jgi:hypothetical protein